MFGEGDADSESLTVVWDDGPGHGGGVDASDHPEHAEPAQMLAPLLLGQELRVIGENNRDGAADAAQVHRERRLKDEERSWEESKWGGRSIIRNTDKKSSVEFFLSARSVFILILKVNVLKVKVSYKGFGQNL